MAHAVFTLHGISGAGGKMLSSVIILHSIWYLFHCFLRANVIFTLDPVERHNRLNLKFYSIRYDSITPQHPPAAPQPHRRQAGYRKDNITDNVLRQAASSPPCSPHTGCRKSSCSPHMDPV